MHASHLLCGLCSCVEENAWDAVAFLGLIQRVPMCTACSEIGWLQRTCMVFWCLSCLVVQSLSPLLHCRAESVCFFWGIFMFDALLFPNPVHVTRAQMRTMFSEADRMPTPPAIPRRHCEQHEHDVTTAVTVLEMRSYWSQGEAREHYTHTHCSQLSTPLQSLASACSDLWGRNL